MVKGSVLAHCRLGPNQGPTESVSCFDPVEQDNMMGVQNQDPNQQSDNIDKMTTKASSSSSADHQVSVAEFTFKSGS